MNIVFNCSKCGRKVEVVMRDQDYEKYTQGVPISSLNYGNLDRDSLRELQFKLCRQCLQQDSGQ